VALPMRVTRVTATVVTHAPSMTPGRWIFLVVLAVFFCSLFTGAYIWMRRPKFGDDDGPADAQSTGLERTTSPDGRPMLLTTASQRARMARLQHHPTSL
jgi:hypothetical protein